MQLGTLAWVTATRSIQVLLSGAIFGLVLSLPCT